jgi:hypothetical protein
MTERHDLGDQLRAAAQEHHPKQPRKRRNPWPFVAAGALVVLGAVGITVGLTSRNGDQTGASATTTARPTTAAPTTTAGPTTTTAKPTTATAAPTPPTVCQPGQERGMYENHEFCSTAANWQPSPEPRPTTTTAAPTSTTLPPEPRCADGATRPPGKSLPDEWCVMGVWVGASAELWWHDLNDSGFDPAASCADFADGWRPKVKDFLVAGGWVDVSPYDVQRICAALAGTS